MSNQTPLFALPEKREDAGAEHVGVAAARVVRPQRHQLRWEARDLDAALAPDHPARAIWELIERLDLSSFYASIRSVIEGPGRPATDPRVLLALWVYASTDNVGSARQLARLCEEHDVYRWLRGDVPVNHHMLADFRARRAKELDELLSQVIATLMAAGAVSLRQVSQDGLRVRAWAGQASYRGETKLQECLKEARAEVKRLAQQREQPDPKLSARQQAAQERAARERLERVERALSYLPQLEASKDKQRKRKGRASEKVSEARVSTTDPEVSVMRMADGGYRPGYNVQLATDGEHGVIVGVSVSASGSDAGLALPMYEQVRHRTGSTPGAYLMDGGFVTKADITALAQHGSDVYAPLRPRRSSPETLSTQPRPGDTPEVLAWRQRMTSPDAQTTYRNRASTAEWTNAQLRQHGVGQFNLRGIVKLTSLMLLVCLSHNLMRWLHLNS